MVNPVRSSEVRGAARRTVKVIHQATEVATALMIFGNKTGEPATWGSGQR